MVTPAPLGRTPLTMQRLAADLAVTPMAPMAPYGASAVTKTWSPASQTGSGASWRSDVDPAAPWPAQLQVLPEWLVDVLRARPSASRLLGRVRHGPARPRAAARAGPVPSRPAA